MSNSANARRSARQERIDIGSPQDVRIWAMSFGVSEQNLRRAVERAGNDAESVRTFLDGPPG